MVPNPMTACAVPAIHSRETGRGVKTSRGLAQPEHHANAAIYQLHQKLFLSSGHRNNILNDGCKVTGIRAQTGQFTSGANFNAEMVTLGFAPSGAHKFVTGVAYHDTDNNNVCSIGEGDGGIPAVVYSAALSVASTAMWGSGAFSLDTKTITGLVGIAFTGGSLTGTIGATLDLRTTNVKIDHVNSSTIQSSVSARLIDAAVNLMLLGINAIDGTGNPLGNLSAANTVRSK
jgi:hypothetical protein